MQILSAIEIRYLRSIYRARIPRLASVNVLSGRNDSGKSNVLKALNLFFSGDVDWQRPFSFYRDFSAVRLEQVRKESIKGKQFISITLDFVRPESYKGSLPPTARVTRTWLRDAPTFTETTNLEASSKAGRLPSTLETAKRFLSIFLNRVHYEYIPAVKDRAYFDHLLSGLQAALLVTPTDSDAEISQVAAVLAQHIQGRIGDLQADFERATGIGSAVQPPQEFADLFQAFQVTTASGEASVPLSLRGDGIQARFIPSVLDYISKRSSRFFIWGFEEPENSLEYPRVVDLASDFVARYAQNAQIFITTHSPAFTSLATPDTTCSRVFTTAGQTTIAPVWPASKDPEQLAALREETGFLRIQEELHDEYVAKARQLEALQTHVKDLKEEIRRHGLPLLLTEGATDTQILETAWLALRGDGPKPFIIRSADPAAGAPAGGAGGAGSLAKTIETIHPLDGRKAIAVFDRDQEGIREFRSLSANFHSWNHRDDVKQHANALAHAILLPIPPGRELLAQHQCLCIELLFPDDAVNSAGPNGEHLELRPLEIKAVAGSRLLEIPEDVLRTAVEQALPEVGGIQRVTGGKAPFAYQIVPGLAPAAFAAFAPLFQTVEDILR